MEVAATKDNGRIQTNLRTIRLERGLSLFRLGVAINRTPETVRLYERGEIYPRGDVMFQIAKVLGVEVRDLWPDIEQTADGTNPRA